MLFSKSSHINGFVTKSDRSAIDFLHIFNSRLVVNRVKTYWGLLFKSAPIKPVGVEFFFVLKSHYVLGCHPFFNLCLAFALLTFWNVAFFKDNHQVRRLVSVIVTPNFKLVEILDAAHLLRSIEFQIWLTFLLDWVKRRNVGLIGYIAKIEVFRLTFFVL